MVQNCWELVFHFGSPGRQLPNGNRFLAFSLAISHTRGTASCHLPGGLGQRTAQVALGNIWLITEVLMSTWEHGEEGAGQECDRDTP